MFFKKKTEIEVKSSFTGKVVSLENVSDPMFSEKILGDGIAIQPQNGILYAPISGEVTMIVDTKHAIGFNTQNTITVLMHIGIDTVELEGKGFNLDIKQGDKVFAGQEIGKIDLDYIKSEKKEVVTPILIADSPQYKINYQKQDGEDVKAGETIFKIVL